MPFADLPTQSPMSPEAERYAAWCREASSKALANTRHVLDIAYGTDYWQKMDLYLPHESEAGLPTLFFMHGGYWTHGYKEWLGFMAPAFVSLPAIFISVSYRLAPAAPYPAALADPSARLVPTIETYGGDPHRLYRRYSAGHWRHSLHCAPHCPAMARARIPLASQSAGYDWADSQDRLHFT